jgi:FHS family glucose/mannose:H+ symporter-like MFS transporter
VPYLAFASNFTWVMVMGLMGPSVPAIIEELGIGYSRAGLFFTMLSMGSLVGTFLAGTASDHLNRRILFAGIALSLCLGLFSVALASTFTFALLAVLFFSLTGSPAGTVGQSIMLEMFPERRECYIALLTMFASVGSLTAPLLVALNFQAGLGWRWPFVETGLVALLLALVILLVRLPRSRGSRLDLKEFGRLLAHPRVLSTALLIVLSVGPDLGFSFWLAQHFRSELGVSLQLSSGVVSVYLLGMIAGRLATSRLVRTVAPGVLLCLGPLAALASLAAFLLAPWMPVKLAAILVYGLGVAPIFPLLMARGTAVFPERPGAVSGLLFGSVSLGGMIFPQALGMAAEHIGIRSSYALMAVLLRVILLASLVALRRQRPRVGASQAGGEAGSPFA